MALIRTPEQGSASAARQPIELGWIALTLDDIQDVLDLLEKRGADPTMLAGSAIATDAESLKSATRAELANVVIIAKGGRLRVALPSRLPIVEFPMEDPELAALAGEIGALLRPRRVRGVGLWWWLFRSHLWPLLGLGLFALAAFGVSGLLGWEAGTTNALSIARVVMPVLIVLAAWMALVDMPTSRKSGATRIRLDTRASLRNSLFEMQQNLAVTSANTILSVALGVLIGTSSCRTT